MQEYFIGLLRASMSLFNGQSNIFLYFYYARLYHKNLFPPLFGLLYVNLLLHVVVYILFFLFIESLH